MRLTRIAPLVAIVVRSLLLVGAARAGGTGISSAGDDANPNVIGCGQGNTSRLFNPYHVPASRGPFAHRDIQFLWSPTYATLGHSLVNPDGSECDLDRLGVTICQSHQNPFGFGFPDMQLVYDYLNFDNATYNATDPLLPGFVLSLPRDPGATTADRSKLDSYLYAPDVSSTEHGDNPSLGNRGASPSDFTSSNEDVDVGHNNNLSDVHSCNSLSIAGPGLAQVGDTSPSAGLGPTIEPTGSSITRPNTPSTRLRQAESCRKSSRVPLRLLWVSFPRSHATMCLTRGR